MAAAPILIVAGLGGINVYQLHTIDTKTRFIAEKQVESMAVLGEVARVTNEMRIGLRDHFLSQNASEHTSGAAHLTENSEALTKLLARYGDALISDEKDLRLYTEFRDLSREWTSGAEALIAMAVSGQPEEARRVYVAGPVPALGQRLSNAQTEWIRHNESLARDASDEALAVIASSRRRLGWAMAGLVSGSSWQASRSRCRAPAAERRQGD